MQIPATRAPGRPATIIVLNGTSSAGKTSLARAMQLIWDAPLHHVQQDAFRAMEPPGYWDGWEHRDTESVNNMMAALCGAMHAAVLAFARYGQNVVLDVALTNSHARRLLVENLSGSSALLVAVHCASDELNRREHNRGDRSPGLAASQVPWLHQPMRYDLEVDTTSTLPHDSATEVLRWVQTRPVPSALVQMHTLQNAA